MVYSNRVQPLPHHTAACAASKEKFCAAGAVGLPGLLKAVGLAPARQADPEGLLMVTGMVASLGEISVLGCPFLSVWSRPGGTTMKDQLSVFSILRPVVGSGGELSRAVGGYILTPLWCNNRSYQMKLACDGSRTKRGSSLLRV